MNIAIDIRPLMHKERTGVGEYTYELLDALFRIDYTDLDRDFTDNKPHYFLFYNSYKDVSTIVPQWKYDNVHYVVTRWPNKLFNLFVWLGIIKLDKWVVTKSKIQNPKSKIDWWFSPNLHFTSLSKNTRHILTIHDLTFEFFKDFYSWKRRLWHSVLRPKKQCSRADLILTPSKNTKRDVVWEYDIHGDKVRVLYPGLSKKFLGQHIDEKIKKQVREKYNLPEKFILFLGTLEPRKNILGLIQAYKSSALHKKGYELILAGARGWKDKHIFQHIDNTPGVRYIGYVEDQDKKALYTRAKLFLFPSLYEGFGFPVLEAASCSTSVITSNRSALPEVVGNQAYYVNPYSVVEIKRAMERLVENDYVNDGVEERVKVFDWETAVEKFLSLLKII